MKDSKNRGIIRLGDTTDHGGRVITAQPDFKVYGKRVAVEGDKVRCPQCKGVFLITPIKEDREHHGKIVAYEGDRTTCGARLISSI
ncbi:PAAR domain-containing protein [Pseudoduganella sp. SL102]|uniref:PAAR domain-containing protein n=1 Tax=Pseudoduganella sp. SL102 TaxID=2995154 RepID=UPI00248C21DF|nr:PAAR domain-containing protein [Pseudoduganella sp. SL102]WBS02750.1 PAAR domain-containing protein [Pseudoduganella sp. SL102]